METAAMSGRQLAFRRPDEGRGYREGVTAFVRAAQMDKGGGQGIVVLIVKVVPSALSPVDHCRPR